MMDSASSDNFMDRSKCLDSSDCLVGRDSGFLSGSCATESEIDVGSASTSYQRLDSGVDLGLSVSGLSLGPDPKVIPIPNHPKEINLKEYHQWEQYFYPDEDGDT